FAPGPDMRRLSEIETRLLRAAPPVIRRRTRGVPWWALILLAGGAAAAAWWGAGHSGGHKTTRDDHPPGGAMERAAPEGAVRPGSPHPGRHEGDPRIIDRREGGR